MSEGGAEGDQPLADIRRDVKPQLGAPAEEPEDTLAACSHVCVCVGGGL